MTWTVGATVSWVLEVRDLTGVLADLGGGLPTATVLLPDTPDNTTAPAVVTKSSTGIYRADHLTTQPGRHLVTWTGSGANSGALPYTDIADVWPANPRMIVGLTDARNALNTLGASRINDREILGYLVAATLVIEHLAGPQLQAVHVESHWGGGAALGLHHQPTDIVSVVEDGTLLTPAEYIADEGPGLLWRGVAPGAGVWSRRRTVVTYRVGSPIVPQNVVLAAAHLVAHWWRQTQQSSRPALGIPAGEAPPLMVAGYAVPNMVIDLLAPADCRLPGMA